MIDRFIALQAYSIMPRRELGLQYLFPYPHASIPAHFPALN